MVTSCVNFNILPFQHVCSPVEVGIKLLEPGVSKDEAVPSQVCHIKSQFFCVITSLHPEVAELGDCASLVGGAINIVNHEGSLEGFCQGLAGPWYARCERDTVNARVQ